MILSPQSAPFYPRSLERWQCQSRRSDDDHTSAILTVATLVALYRTNELPIHLNRALDNGVSRDELIEMITHLAFYAGWPAASSAVTIVRRVFQES